MFGGTGTGGFTFGQATPASTSAATTGGFTFGNVATQPSTGLGGFQTSSTTATSTGTGGGFNFGTNLSTPATTSSLLAQALNAASSATSTAGLGTTTTAAPSLLGTPSLGGAAKPLAATGFSLGGTSTVTSAPVAGFGTLPGTTAAKPATTTLGGLTGGFGFGKTTAGATSVTTTKPTTSFNLGGTLTTSTASGLGGTTTGGSVFSNVASKPQTTGLGGVDPKTSQTTSGGTTTDTKPGDGKTLKESQLPPEIVTTVDEFQKYVKDEKAVQDNITRMSTKPMYKVQEDVAALKKLLSVVSNGIQRNTCAVEKLKREMTQELKNAEMAQRTKDIPPGLQYENMAPNEYFQKLVEDFEHRMLSYRQQIETLEGHLASLHQPSKLSPDELIGLMRKLHEAFIALAAQLHHVHEAVKTQKEHYLNYRKIFLHDTKDIFDREKKATHHAKIYASTNLGPNPFTGMSNAAAIAMATALSRSQQPTGGPPVAGLGATGTLGVGGSSIFGTTSSTGLGFGSTTTTQSTGFTGFGGSTNTGVSLFGGGSTGFNLSNPQPAFGFGTTTPAFGASVSNPDTPFQLNKPPPPGSKRGKR